MMRSFIAALPLCLMLLAATAKADPWGKNSDQYASGMLGSSPQYHQARGHRHHKAPAGRWGMVSVETAAGPVTVAPSFAYKIQGFIRDVVDRGFRGRVNCYASGGHVRNSLHYSGQACDFAQRGWGRTVPPMYHVADLASKWGLRDGCTFRDCGHIDAGGQLAGRHRHHRYRHYARR